MTDTDDEFARAMADVVPLSPARRKVAADKSPAMSAAAEAARRAAALGIESEDKANPLTEGEVPPVEPHAVIAWKQDGVQTAVFDKLRSGNYRIGADLDLHGLTVAEARRALFRFIRHERGLGRRALLIAHGRGERSPTPARLKSYVAHWLEQLPEVIAFHSALPRQGGTGAVYVLLKKLKTSTGPLPGADVQAHRDDDF